MVFFIVYLSTTVERYQSIQCTLQHIFLHGQLIYSTVSIYLQGISFFAPLDANLIEGEPYNRLARRLNVARQNSDISEMWETGFKNPPRPLYTVYLSSVSACLQWVTLCQKWARVFFSLYLCSNF